MLIVTTRWAPFACLYIVTVIGTRRDMQLFIVVHVCLSVCLKGIEFQVEYVHVFDYAAGYGSI